MNKTLQNPRYPKMNIHTPIRTKIISYGDWTLRYFKMTCQFLSLNKFTQGVFLHKLCSIPLQVCARWSHIILISIMFQCQLRIKNKPWFINCEGSLQIGTMWHINGTPQINCPSGLITTMVRPWLRPTWHHQKAETWRRATVAASACALKLGIDNPDWYSTYILYIYIILV